jgi:hypothetical protein
LFIDRLGARHFEVEFQATQPPLLVTASLSFIEDRDLLDPEHPNRNPAIEWRRFLLAALARWGIDLSQPKGRRRQHARHLDRESPLLGRRAHGRPRRQVRADVIGAGASLF